MATLSSPLKNYRILIVDADVELSGVLKNMLSEMGFVHLHSCRSGREAINLLRNTPFDFLITEWNTQHINGLELLKHIRRSPESPNCTIPVIMLTGRAEVADVRMARDYGINEYVVKPFSARTIYSRLERIIEQPRGFVVAKGFVGPDRRAHMKPADEIEEKREIKPLPKPLPKNIVAELASDIDVPKFWLPDFSLKLKLGKNMKLGDFITPSVLNNAQAAIDSITNDSLQWIKDNLNELKQLNAEMKSDNCPEDITASIADVALLVNSRAGTFGYSRASEIAYALYLFARNKLQPKNNGHHVVIQNHIEVLYIILGNQMQGSAGEIGVQVAAELKALIAKYS